ncbi:MAG: helix-turn-helix transcriptional regulator [Chloroflexota bacterium]|nr:helix-turn-helix transcriptional regulator [Chloroflexota bacterium]
MILLHLQGKEAMTDADNVPISFAEQLQLLLDYLPDMHHQLSSPAQLARLLNMSPQAVLNLLNGHTTSPRLDTARALCQCFGVSLDYFALTTRQACETYLKQQVVARSTPTVQAINTHVSHLTPHVMKRVLVVLSWAERAIQQSTAQHQRKHP